MANEFNKKFIEKFFPNETVGENYPKVNYRLRLAGLTTFEPYFSEASKLSSETDSEYNARVNTSGKFYEEQEILLDNVVNSATNVAGYQKQYCIWKNVYFQMMRNSTLFIL